MSRKSWIEETFFKRECVKFVSSSGDLHRCVPVCQVCLSLIRCCCGRLMGEHTSEKFIPPISLNPNPGSDTDEEWCVKRHSRASPTDAYGIVDFEDTATRVCRAKYLRLAVDSKPEAILHLMLKEWQMERPKLLLSVYGGSKNFSLSPKVEQAFSKGLMTAALSTGAWILTNGINTGVSKYVGEAVKIYGGHDLRKRNTVGITPWGVIDNNADLIGRDVFRPYQPLGNPLGKGVCLNGFHSHFLFVDDGTLRKHGCQQDLRRKLEKQINFLKIHPRLNFGVPVVCVVLEGGPAVISTVLHYVSSVPPVPVFVFEGSGRTADLLAFLHKQTATHKELEADIKDDFLMKIGQVFAVDQSEASHLYSLLLQCMDHRQCITIYDSESEDHVGPDAAILTATMKGTKASPAEQLSMALAWDRADIARKDVLVYGHHWKEGSLEKTMLDALVMDRVSFVKLLIDYGMTMNRFLTVDTLEELYNTHTQGQMKRFFHHLVEDVKQTSLPLTYRLSIIDMGLVIEYLIGGAYRSSYTRKHFRTAYNHLRSKGTRQSSSASLFKQHQGQGPLFSIQTRSSQNLHFFRTAQPYKHKDSDALPGFSQEMSLPAFSDNPLLISFNFNDLFVWAVLQQRQQMALFLWQHGEEALARATVACKLYRSMATEARLSSMDDNISERFRAYSLEFGQLAVDVLDCAFRQNEQMAMKLLTSEMEGWSHFTCLQMAVSSGHRPFVSHSCTQTLLTDLWTGSLNMRKNSFLKIILSLLLPPFILILEFKSKAEMCHVPQSHEAMLFEHDSVDSLEINKGADMGSVDVESSVSFHGRCLCPLSETVSSLSNHCLSWITRIYKFYTAPVVKFWFHTMSYLAFLMLFSYTVLIKMGDQPSVQEWLVIAFVFSTALEKIREVFMSEPRKLSQKLKIWFSEYWNISDFIAIILFVFGFLLRWYSEPYLTAGRICYCLDIIFWFIRVMDLLAVNQHAGPYLTMITKMTRNMFFIVVMMAIVLLSFGVSRKSILSPNEEPSWSLARDVVFQPYWMIYGEVYAGEIDTCADGVPCAPASFLTPFLQAVYMFVQYIIMVNILIAFFNCTLPQTNETDLPYCNSCKSTPLSLFKDCNVAAGRRISLEYHGGARGCRGHTNREVYCSLAYPISSRESVNHHKDQTPCDSHGPSTSTAPLSPNFCDRGFGRLWTQESNTDSKVEEDEQETQDNVDFKSSSQVELLDEHKDKPSEGLTNPAFCSGSNQASPPSSLSSQWKSSSKHFRWSQLSRDHPYQYCRSLSSSVENLTFSGKHLSQNHGSFPHFNEPLMKGKKLQATRDRGWSKSSDFMNDIESKGQSHNKKTVKIQESHPHTALQSELSEAWWRRRQRFKGEGRCWSASASLSQLSKVFVITVIITQ